jgi:hypothetical protein
MPAESAGSGAFHKLRFPVAISRRNTGAGVCPRRMTNNSRPPADQPVGTSDISVPGMRFSARSRIEIDFSLRAAVGDESPLGERISEAPLLPSVMGWGLHRLDLRIPRRAACRDAEDAFNQVNAMQMERCLDRENRIRGNQAWNSEASGKRRLHLAKARARSSSILVSSQLRDMASSLTRR